MPSPSVLPDLDVVRRALSFIGAPEDSIVMLDPAEGVTGDNADYADLLRAELGQAIGAVIEKDGSPVIYIADLRSRKGEGRELARLLGNRGETAALVAIDESDAQGMLAKAWPCALQPPEALELDLFNSVDAHSVLADLQTGIWYRSEWKYGYQEESLRDLLISSVAKVSAAFSAAAGIKAKDPRRSDEVLALMGRALFTRFLLDRRILSASTAPKLWGVLGGDGGNAFESPERATATCEWLDDVFNGEFLPFKGSSSYFSYFNELQLTAPDALVALGWIVNRTNANGQLPLWDRLDFSYIPAGTLSEVYENYAHSLNKNDASATSIHYTPRHLARMMVRQALAGLDPECAPDARLLDPAVGAGVFLSIGLREIVKRRAIRDKAWPTTRKLRSILYQQMRGMDINGAALNLAALTLYLTVVELDADPLPPQKLKFDTPLLGSVLFNVSEAGAGAGPVRLGSLCATNLGGDKFDVVIGNPPWTSPPSAPKTYSDEIEKIARSCIARRAVETGVKYQHPDKVPDLAFFWKSSEWLREGGILALILHQRMLIKRTSNWSQARQALMASFKFHGILNAGQFADHSTLIWPGIESPFCIVFATNEAPPPKHRFRMLNLELEPTLKKRRQLRIDPGTVFSVAASDFEELPGAMIVRTKGCELDRQLLLRWHDRMVPAQASLASIPSGEQKGQTNVADSSRPSRQAPQTFTVRSAPLVTIERFVESFADAEPRRGIKNGNKGAEVPDWFSALPNGTLEFTGQEAHALAGHVDASEITTTFFSRPVKSTPLPRWFAPPLLLIKEAPGERFEPTRTTLITSDGPAVAYSFSYIGVPIAAGEAAMLRAKYLAVWINSSVFSYFTTLTSTRFGFGRKVANNDELLQCPIVDLDIAIQMGKTDQDEIEKLFSMLKSPDRSLLWKIDDLVAKVMGIDEEESQLIEDTLSISYPIGESRQSGKSWVRPTQFEGFVRQLRSDLMDADDIFDPTSIEAMSVGAALDGWRFLRWSNIARNSVSSENATDQTVTDETLLELVKQSYPSGQVVSIAPDGSGGVFGQLALSRLWLPSRASLIAQLLIAKVEAVQS